MVLCRFSLNGFRILSIIIVLLGDFPLDLLVSVIIKDAFMVTVCVQPLCGII